MKKKYNTHTGTYEYYDSVTGAGFFYIISKIGTKIASDSAKKALEKAGTQALETGMKRLGDEAGKYTAEKIFKPKPMGNIITKELMKSKEEKDEAIPEASFDSRLNRLLSGGKNKKL